jgi:hypothetical protein
LDVHPYSAVTDRGRDAVKFKSPLTGIIRSRTMTVTGLSIGEATGEMVTQMTDR